MIGISVALLRVMGNQNPASEISTQTCAAIDAQALDTGALVDFIRDQHDMYLRAAVPFIASLAARVAREHERRDPRLEEVRDVTFALRRLLDLHLDEEDDDLFPAIREGRPPADDDVRSVQHEHREIAAAVARLRLLTDGYRAPAWACPCYRTLLEWLDRLETNLMRHVHLENDVLLPRSTCSSMEQQR